MEKRMQDAIYIKFLKTPLSDDEQAQVDQIDNDILVCEFNALMRKKVYDFSPKLHSTPTFELKEFTDVENTFLMHYYGDGLRIWLDGAVEDY